MTRKEIEKEFKAGKKSVGENEKLSALCFMAKLCTYTDWNEVVFTVPAKWLHLFLSKGSKIVLTAEEVASWLRNEYKYTSTQAETLFHSASQEKQLVTIDIF